MANEQDKYADNKDVLAAREEFSNLINNKGTPEEKEIIRREIGRHLNNVPARASALDPSGKMDDDEMNKLLINLVKGKTETAGAVPLKVSNKEGGKAL